jgi:hypothetical protein
MREALLLSMLLVAGSGCGASNGAGDAGKDPCAPFRRLACTTSPTGVCDGDGNPAPPLTPTELKAAQQQHCGGNGAGGAGT